MIKKIRIGAIDYKVECAKRDKDVDDFGSTRTQTATIIYKSEQTSQQLANTLLHECLHAIWDEFDLKDKEDEESVCTKMANGLCALIRNNPDFYIWLGEQLNISRPTKQNKVSKK